MLDDKDVADVLAIIKMFKDEYGYVLEEENADTFIAHICSAYSRNKTVKILLRALRTAV